MLTESEMQAEEAAREKLSEMSYFTPELPDWFPARGRGGSVSDSWADQHYRARFLADALAEAGRPIEAWAQAYRAVHVLNGLFD